MESVEIWQPFPEDVIELRLEGEVVIEVVTRAKRRPMAQCDVLQHTAAIRIHVLIAEEGAYAAELLCHLGIEGRHVVHEWTLQIRVPYQESFAQEFDSV